jgi:transcriptional regulator with XRE-family HTH domain
MNPDRLADFARALVEQRLKHHQKYPTRAAFARALGITRSTLRALEGGRQNPTDETLEKIARVLGTTAHALKGEAPIAADDERLRDLEEEDFAHAQRFHHAPAAAKIAAQTFLGPKLSSEARNRIAYILDLLMRYQGTFLARMEDFAGTHDQEQRRLSTSAAAPIVKAATGPKQK